MDSDRLLSSYVPLQKNTEIDPFQHTGRQTLNHIHHKV